MSEISCSAKSIRDKFYKTMYSPEVDEAFIKRWADKIYDDSRSKGIEDDGRISWGIIFEINPNALIKMLREAGVKIKEGK